MNQSRTSNASDSSLRPALDLAVRDSLRPVAAGIGGLFLLFALMDQLLLGREAWLLSLWTLATSLALFGLYSALGRRQASPAWAHSLAAAIAAVVLANILGHIHLRSVAGAISNISMFIIGIGCFFLSAGWLAAGIAAAIGGWAGVAWLTGVFPRSWHLAYELLAATAISALVFNIRYRSYRRFHNLRLQDEQLKGQLQETVAALRESQHFSRQVADAAPFLLYVFDLEEGRIVYVNSQIAAQLGHTPEEVLGMGRQLIDRLIHPDDHAVVAGLWKQAVKSADGEIIEGEYRIRHVNGEWRWVRSREVVFARNQDASVRRVLGTAHDITDHKQAEEQVRTLNTELEHASRLSGLGEMAAGLAHELHQPLTVIVNYAQGCVHRLKRGNIDKERLIERLQEIADESLRAGEVIRRIRDFLQKRESQQRPIDINTVVRDALELARIEWRGCEVQVEFQPATPLPRVLADGIQITQVVVNLVVNGVQALAGTGNRKRKLLVETRPAEEGFVEVSVTDSGPGICPEMQQEIFEPFFTTKPKGLGMGLAISRSIVMAHGGQLQVVSEPGRGSTFRFTVPVATQFSRENNYASSQVARPR